jgi:hypothetical protein
MSYIGLPLTLGTAPQIGDQVDDPATYAKAVFNSGGIADLATLIAGKTVITADHTAPTNIVANQSPIIVANANGGNVTINLPATSAHSQFPMIIKRIDANPLYTVTINRAGSDTIEDPFAPVLTPTATSLQLKFGSEWVALYPRSTYWQILDSHFYVPGIRVYNTNSQTITTSFANIQHNIVNDYPASSAYDTYGLWDTTNFYYVVPREGNYLVGGAVTVNSGTSAQLQQRLTLNGSAFFDVNIPYSTGSAGIITGAIPSQEVRASVGDTIAFQSQLTAGSRTLFSSGAGRQRYTYMTVSYLGINT